MLREIVEARQKKITTKSLPQKIKSPKSDYGQMEFYEYSV